jgi:L-malate glycosyltransferase
VRIDQVLPSLASRDAIGVHALALTAALRSAGVESDIYYGSCTPDVSDLGKPVVALGRTQRRWLLYHASIGSPVFDVVATRREPKMINFHNITPADLLDGWAPHVSYEVSLGRVQLERLVSESRLAVCDSAFNESELIALGFSPTAVVPLLINMTSTGAPPEPATRRMLAASKSRGGADFLYVGKISPHKAPHDLVKMLAVYRQLYDPLARLHLVGSPVGDRYEPALRKFVDELGLADAVSFVGSVSPSALEAYFECADAYVSASEHEGFCVPVVEAMGHGLPVVAYGVTAVPETVDDAGILLADKGPLRFAAALWRVISDADLRTRLAEAAAGRVAAYDVTTSTRRFVELLTQTAVS